MIHFKGCFLGFCFEINSIFVSRVRICDEGKNEWNRNPIGMVTDG